MIFPRALAAGIATVLCAIPAVGTAQIGSPPDLDRYVLKAMAAFGVPGLSLAIVENGKTVVAKGYGVRSVVTGERVTRHTAFPIGSETKAFTAAALAILVDEGKLRWSDRVVDELPGFKMYDPYATAQMTVRDLLTHRSGLGLGEGDLLFVPTTNRSRANVVHALRYLRPRTGFREAFAYDNITFIVAGQLVQAVSGETWENFIERHIFRPLDMADSRTLYDPAAPNAVTLYARTDGPIHGIGRQRALTRNLDPQVAAPCGSINASADDMANWMAMWQEDGKLPDDRRLLSPAAVHALLSPAVVVPVNEPAAANTLLPQPSLRDYAPGWFVEEDDGHTVIEHTGSMFGALAAIYFIPGKRVAFSIAINSEDSETRSAVVDYLLAYFLRRPQHDWIGKLSALRESTIHNVLKEFHDVPEQYRPNRKSSLPMRGYVGIYTDAWYGAMSVSARSNGRLWVSFNRTPGMIGPLEHVADDTFRTRWTDRDIEDAYVTFKVENNRITSVALKPISPLADFSFDYADLHFHGAVSAHQSGSMRLEQ